jgi:hypothetical protein
MSETGIESAPEPAPAYHWFHKVSALLFIVFCLEVGLFLVIFPWTDKWDDNLFATLLSTTIPHWSEYWQSTYLRGAMSGIGLIDLYICFTEIFRLRRFNRH